MELRQRTLPVLFGWLSFVALGLRGGLLGVAWPSIRAEFHLPLDALGVLLLVYTAGYLLGSFGSGRVLSWANLGVLLALCCLAMTLNLLGTAVTPWWWLMVALGLPAGLGEGIIDASVNTYVATRHSARTLNWLHASFGVGVTVSPLLMTAVLEAEIVWRWGYAVVGIALLALACALSMTRAWWPAPRELVAAIGSSSGAAGIGFRATLRLPLAWLAMALFFIYAGAEVTAGQWAFSLFTESRGVPSVQAGVWVGAYWAGLTIGRILFGVVLGLTGTEAILRVCLAGVVVGMALIWLHAAPILSLLGLALAGFAQAPIYPVLVAMTPGRFGALHTPNVVGFEVAAGVLGGAALPALVGVAAERHGLEVVGPTLVLAAFLQIGLYAAWAVAGRVQHQFVTGTERL